MAQPGVRLSAGSLKGRSLAVLEGVRPTEARVREALFDIVGPGIRGAAFLDLFAGSGAVGLEALSRGASRIVQIDGASGTERRLRAVYEDFGLASARCRRLELPGQLGLLAPSYFDWIFADPPYDFDEYAQLLVAALPLLADGGVMVVEHRVGLSIAPSDGWIAERERRYGTSVLSFFSHDG